MKIVLIITDFGSFNNFLTELALAISNDPSLELHVICSNDKIINIGDKYKFPRNIQIHYVAIPRKIAIIKEILASVNINKIIKQIKPDIIHSHFTTATFPTILLKNSGFKYWATFHGLGMNSSVGIKKIVFLLVESICFFRLNKIFTVNNKDFNLVNKLFKNKVKKYNCLGFGCDINKFDNKSISIEAKIKLKERYKIEDDQFVITFTGRFVSFKGFDLVIKSFKILNHLYPSKFKLILMGGIDPIHKTGLNEDESYFLNNCIDIINIGFTNNVEEYLNISDIFLFPSKKEGLPTCILEALSMGLPVVTFDARGNNDIIKNGYNGILMEPTFNISLEVKAIVEVMEVLVTDKEQLRILRENALRNRHEYSRKRFVDEQLQYYSELV